MSLLAGLRSAADTMWVLQQSTKIVQNNVANVSTPGFAKQGESLAARPFDSTTGLAGGVKWVGTVDSRNQFAERNVRNQMTSSGFAQKQSDALTQIEGTLPVGEDAGIAGAMSNLFKAFSSLTISPNDGGLRQSALDRAKDVALQFNTAGNQLDASRTSVYQDISQTVDKLNALGKHLQEINVQIQKNAESGQDSALQADLYQTMEQLSQLTNATFLSQDDGTVSAFVGGQDLFVQGDSFYPVQVSMASGNAKVEGLNGTDITSMITSGELGGLLDLHRNAIPGFQANLNQLATAFADTLNNTLAGGIDSSGNPPTTPLFTYDPVLGAARTLSVTNLQPQELALASPGAAGGNGNALTLAGLVNSKPLNGFTFAGFYGTVSAQVGKAAADSKDQADLQQGLVTQAQSLRDGFSRVSLDEEAVALVEFQRSYQAMGQLVKALDEMTQTVIGMMQ